MFEAIKICMCIDGNYLVIKYGPTLRVRVFVGRGRVSYNKILWTVTRTHNYTLALSSSSVSFQRQVLSPVYNIEDLPSWIEILPGARCSFLARGTR